MMEGKTKTEAGRRLGKRLTGGRERERSGRRLGREEGLRWRLMRQHDEKRCKSEKSSPGKSE